MKLEKSTIKFGVLLFPFMIFSQMKTFNKNYKINKKFKADYVFFINNKEKGENEYIKVADFEFITKSTNWGTISESIKKLAKKNKSNAILITELKQNGSQLRGSFYQIEKMKIGYVDNSKCKTYFLSPNVKNYDKFLLEVNFKRFYPQNNSYKVFNTDCKKDLYVLINDKPKKLNSENIDNFYLIINDEKNIEFEEISNSEKGKIWINILNEN